MKKVKEETPYLLAKISELTKSRSLEANKALILNNAKLGALLAAELSGKSLMKMKAQLGLALKKMMVTTKLDEISVINLTKECNVNRQTFYYHYRNIYDLFNLGLFKRRN